jgi:hypothetical protein
MFVAAMQCGISPEEFWQCSFWEYRCLLEGARLRQIAEWKRSRFFTAAIMNIFSKRRIRPEQLVRFKEDDGQKTPLMTLDEFKELEKRWAHLAN